MKGYVTDDRGQVGIGTLIVFIALVLVAAIAAGVLINTAGFLQTQAEETGQDSTDQVADNINVIGEVGEVGEFSDTGDNIEENYIYETRLTVQRSPGSDDIDLTGLSIQYVGDNGFAQLIHVSEVETDPDVEDTNDVQDDVTAAYGSSGDDRGDAAYLVEEITAESDGDAVMTDDGDRYEIVIPLGYADDDTNAVIFDDEAGEDVDDIDEPANLDTAFDYDDADFDDLLVFDNGDLNLLQEGQTAELEITTDAGSQRNVAISAPDTLIDEEGGTVTL